MIVRGGVSIDDPFPDETGYGIRARLEYFFSEIEAHRAAVGDRPRILEVGCGTGALVTKPLATVLPEASFEAIDVHRPSIVEARKDVPQNVRFRVGRIEDEADESYDVVICSEVLEHLPDPREMIDEVRRILRPSAIALVTIPNGYGPKEIEDFIKRGLMRILPMLRRFTSTDYTVASLNPEGHLQFFTMRRFRRLMTHVGLEIVRYQGRRVLGGPFSSRVLLTPALRTWNARLARRLPHWAVSSWMFTLRR